MNRLKRFAFALLMLSVASAAPARAGNRADHWSGFDFGGGIPFPALGGVLVGFNIGDDARISFGGGSALNWIVYQLDAKFFLSPQSVWSPYLGGGFDYLNGDHGSYLGRDYQFDNAFIPYIQFGFDYQAASGFHMMLGGAAAAPNGRLLILPGLALGWYF
jgi:hypothetical protein